jgi:hypothetical protein
MEDADQRDYEAQDRIAAGDAPQGTEGAEEEHGGCCAKCATRKRSSKGKGKDRK